MPYISYSRRLPPPALLSWTDPSEKYGSTPCHHSSSRDLPARVARVAKTVEDAEGEVFCAGRVLVNANDGFPGATISPKLLYPRSWCTVMQVAIRCGYCAPRDSRDFRFVSETCLVFPFELTGFC